MDKFADVLQGVLDKLGIAATYLWPKAVLYTVVYAAMEIVTALAAGCFLLYVSRLLHARAAEREEKGICDPDVTAVLRILSWGAFIIGPLLFMMTACNTIPTFFAPEYAAVRDLISAGAPKK